MHTAHTLNGGMFAIEIDGKRGTREALLDWQPDDRLGVVITEPLGGLGASLMIQLAITAYYDTRPERRNSPHYPENYVFHVGGRYGDFSTLDVRPARRQVFVPGVVELIGALNAHSISHLLVPDGAFRDTGYLYLESEASREQVRHCFAYSASGRTARSDIRVQATDRTLDDDVANTIDAARVIAIAPEWLQIGDAVQRADTATWYREFRSRLGEVSAEDRAARMRQRETNRTDGLVGETYRRIGVDDAFGFSGYPQDHL